MSVVWKLYYDGGCNLCHTNKLRVERWAEAAGQPLEALPIQSEEGAERGYDLHDMVLITDRESRGADAWLVLMTLSPWYLRWLSWLRFFPPTLWIARLGYRVVASTRYLLFGRRACELPQKK